MTLERLRMTLRCARAAAHATYGYARLVETGFDFSFDDPDEVWDAYTEGRNLGDRLQMLSNLLSVIAESTADVGRVLLRTLRGDSDGA